MRRGSTIALALMVTLSLALPAGAKGKPEKPASTYEVTMEFIGDSPGLATTCSGDPVENHPIIMTGSLNNVLSVWQPMLETNLPIGWYRDYPLPGSSGGALTGCHGGVEVTDPGPQVFPGAIWLTFGKDSGKDTVTFQWRFDYYWQFGEKEIRGKKTRYPQEVLEMFELKSEKLEWQEDGTVEGEFSLTLFTKIEAGITHFWEPMTGSPANLRFNLTIMPLP